MSAQYFGVYFLANDIIRDLVIAFLNSFRRHNPELPLFLIPFDNNFEIISSYSSYYRFSVFDNKTKLDRCDQISRLFHNEVFGHYRKLCAWEGKFENFMYIDCDTVILKDVSLYYEFLKKYDFIVMDSDKPHLRQWVWRDSIVESKALEPEQIAFSANTGFFSSKRQALTIENAEQRCVNARMLAIHMNLDCVEQSFLNYLIVTSGRPYTSVSRIGLTERRRLPMASWPGRIPLYKRWSMSAASNPQISIIHWANLWRPTAFDDRIFQLKKAFGINAQPPTVRLLMPLKRLWNHYRYLNEPDPKNFNSAIE